MDVAVDQNGIGGCVVDPSPIVVRYVVCNGAVGYGGIAFPVVDGTAAFGHGFVAGQAAIVRDQMAVVVGNCASRHICGISEKRAIVKSCIAVKIVNSPSILLGGCIVFECTMGQDRCVFTFSAAARSPAGVVHGSTLFYCRIALKCRLIYLRTYLCMIAGDENPCSLVTGMIAMECAVGDGGVVDPVGIRTAE